jgi:hypothetical protein
MWVCDRCSARTATSLVYMPCRAAPGLVHTIFLSEASDGRCVYIYMCKWRLVKSQAAVEDRSQPSDPKGERPLWHPRGARPRASGLAVGLWIAGPVSVEGAGAAALALHSATHIGRQQARERPRQLAHRHSTESVQAGQPALSLHACPEDLGCHARAGGTDIATDVL